VIKRVVDTNVTVVANGRDTHASPDCQAACIKLLISLRDTGRVIIDSNGGILAEYAKCLFAKGQPGVGDLFYRHVLDNRGNRKSVGLAEVDHARAKPLQDSFLNGGNRDFDMDDRVFAVVALVAKVPVAVALDSDWAEHEQGLAACGVSIEYVCGRGAAQKKHPVHRNHG